MEKKICFKDLSDWLKIAAIMGIIDFIIVIIFIFFFLIFVVAGILANNILGL